MGLLVLYQGPEKERAEGGVNTGWMGCLWVRDSVMGEVSAQEIGNVSEEAVPG